MDDFEKSAWIRHANLKPPSPNAMPRRGFGMKRNADLGRSVESSTISEAKREEMENQEKNKHNSKNEFNSKNCARLSVV